MKKYYSYPAVFEQAESNIAFYFPDFPGSSGTDEDIEKGIIRACELLESLIDLYLQEGKELPKPSDPKNIELFDSTDQIIFIDVEAQRGE